ncbi:hypothetical protein GX51_01001 [Blastomyces parvus]|uniref:Uncharacterized protein n=1 Tax=Blastomyces parvus TaxID=2060905 RepID=A0A2B7XBB7_9EURO|nr:hypothetical protein GX51_01001 [Blastomyces parvus]
MKDLDTEDSGTEDSDKDFVTMEVPEVINPLELHVLIKERRRCLIHLLPLVPPQFARAIEEILQAWAKCFLGFRYLKHILHSRYLYTCSSANPIHYNEHVNTIARLLTWKAQHPGPNDPNLFPTAKLPRHAVQLHPDKTTYDQHFEVFENMRLQFLIGPYLAWYNAKRVLDHLLASAFILLPRAEVLMVRIWWEGFMRGIPPWEEMVENLKFPVWEVVMRDVERKIAETVDLEGEWERIC